MTAAQRNINRKIRVLEYARECGNVARAYRYYGISRVLLQLAPRLRTRG
jgi:hypothetical protein